MKIFKILLIGIASLVVLLLIVALLVKKDYAIEREITINKPKQQVFDYIKFLKNQDHYSKWAMMDPDMKKEYRGTDGTAGFVSAWDSQVKNVGKGEQEIIKITDGERLDFEIRFLKPFQTTDNAYMTTEATSDTQTKVKWGFTGSMPYPMNLMLLCINMDKEVGGDLEIGLTNLKSVLEKQ